MENFFYDDEYYHSIEDLIDENDLEDLIQDAPDDWKIEVYQGIEQPAIKLSVDWIIDRISAENLTNDGDVWEEVERVLSRNIDFERINARMPRLWFISREKHVITKQDILDAL